MNNETNIVIAESHRSRVRSCGLAGDHWYPVEMDKNLPRKGRKEVVWWKQSIALFRDETGVVHAVENRCAHRQLKLTLGQVEGCNLVCAYHGWAFDGSGRCAEIPHEIKVKSKPEIKIRSYPVAVKYGIIWLFPGDPELARTVPLPSCPQLDGPDGWPHVPLDFTWKAHHTMIFENVCDFYHEYLHRRLKPFYKPKLQQIIEKGEDALEIHYETQMNASPIVKIAGARSGVNYSSIKVYFEYPYQRSDTDGKYLHWMFLCPVDETTTRAFFLFGFGPIEVPVLNWAIPRFLKLPVLRLANLLYVRPLLNEDGWILGAEQEAHAVHKARPVFEFNPVVKKMQAITLRKWEQWTASEAARAGKKERPAATAS